MTDEQKIQAALAAIPGLEGIPCLIQPIGYKKHLNPDEAIRSRKHYFINENVEWDLTRYKWTGCTDVVLRDSIMSHATELIRQIIRKQGLHQIYPGHEESAFSDLIHTAWCVTPDSLVISGNGVEEIGDLIGSNNTGNCNFDVQTKNGLNKATKYIRFNDVNLTKITVQYGYNLTASSDHPLFVLSDNGVCLKQVKDIKNGDLIGIQYNQGSFGKCDTINFVPKNNTRKGWTVDSWTESLAYTIGAIVSEGSIEEERIIIYNTESDFKNYIINNCDNLHWREESDQRLVNACPRFIEFVRSLGLVPGIHAPNKFIPKAIFKCSKNIVAAFLRGLFDGDGHSSNFNGSVGYTSTSRKLIDQIRILLLNFGIICKTSEDTRTNSSFPNGITSTNKLTSWQLLLSTNDSMIYYRDIGFNIVRKQLKAIKLSDRPFRLIDSVTTKHLQSCIANHSNADIKKIASSRHLLIKKKRFTVKLFERLVVGLGLANTDQFIKERYDEYCGIKDNMLWLPVENIENNGVGEVIDIEVPSVGNFIVNGIYSSNCQIERTLYKYRARPHCRFCYNPDRPSDSALYAQADLDYHILTYRELLVDGYQYLPDHPRILINKCPTCKRDLYEFPSVEPEQGIFGGSETLIYRGLSKVFNMWCIAPDSMLLGSDGIMTIQEVIDNNIGFVYGINGFKPVNGQLEKPEQDCVKLTTQYNYSITASNEHKFWILRDDGPEWVEVSDINAGDLIGIQYDQQVFFNDDSIDIKLSRKGDWVAPDVITEELAYIIGLFIAEGSYSYGKMVIYNIDTEVIEKLCNNTLGLNFIHEPKFQRVSLCNVRFIEFLIKLGFGERTSAITKFIPHKMLKCSKPIIASMLSGIFDGDGHSKQLDGSVGYTSTSRLLISQLRLLLMNMGILTKVVNDTRTHRNFKDYGSILHGSYNLSISTEYSERFYEDIGFNITRKQNNYNKIKVDDSDCHNGNARLFGLNGKFRSLYSKYGCGKLGYNSIRKVISAKYCSLKTAVSKLKSWSEHSHDHDYQFIVDRIEERQDIVNKIVWLAVKNKDSVRSRLCEISVNSEDHSYIANGFISHNSQVARTVILAYIKKEGRDRKNSGSYKDFVTDKHKVTERTKIDRFFIEAKEICKFNNGYLIILDSLEKLFDVDEKPYDGIISKLVEISNQPRAQVLAFIKMLRLRSHDFTDSPISKNNFNDYSTPTYDYDV